MTVIRSFPLLCCALFAAVCRLTVSAAVTVNAPLTITHRVEVQPIRVGNVAGATVPGLGTATEEAYIKEQINASRTGGRADRLAAVFHTHE